MLYEHYFFAQICGSFSMNVKKGPQNNNLQGVQRDTDSGSKNYRPNFRKERCRQLGLFHKGTKFN